MEGVAMSKTQWGTGYFTSKEAAVLYYSAQNIDREGVERGLRRSSPISLAAISSASSPSTIRLRRRHLSCFCALVSAMPLGYITEERGQPRNGRRVKGETRRPSLQSVRSKRCRGGWKPAKAVVVWPPSIGRGHARLARRREGNKRSLATTREACRSKPPYATAAASSGKRAKDAILA
jgi:hypothetical protein